MYIHKVSIYIYIDTYMCVYMYRIILQSVWIPVFFSEDSPSQDRLQKLFDLVPDEETDQQEPKAEKEIPEEELPKGNSDLVPG